jgi:hypothetical protein
VKRFLVSLLFASLAHPIQAQSSANFRLEAHSFNNGGRPIDGAGAVSRSFLVSLDTVGEALSGVDARGRVYALSAGWPRAFAPAGEVLNLRFLDGVTLAWDPQLAALSYNLYRGLLSDLPGGSTGLCLQQGVSGTSHVDADPVPAAGGFFFLATAVGRLGDEGTMGFKSDGGERINSMPCP